MEKKYIKKQIRFNFGGQKLLFDVNQSLFSSFSVDDGTKMLLNSLRKNLEINYSKILDLGCGYGTMGIFLKKQNPPSEVHCTDRDVLATEFTKHNAILNNCEIKSYPSLDYEEVKDKFSLIITNFPAKAGTEVLKKFVWDASNHLTEKGIFSIVIVRELEKEFREILREGIEIIYEEKKGGYFVFHLGYNKKISFEEDIYFRDKINYVLEEKRYFLNTVRNVPEFEKASYHTELINEILEKLEAKVVGIINPFQGHRAISAEHFLKPKKINLISRDLLQLKSSKENLEINNFFNFDVSATIEIETKGDLLIWIFDKNEDVETIVEKLKLFKKNYNKIIFCDEKKKVEHIIKIAKMKVVDKKEKNNLKCVLIE